MNKEDHHIKPLMQILLGVGLFIFYKMLDNPIRIIEKWKDTNQYDPSDEFFFHFLSWATFLGSIFMIFVGTVQLIKRLISSK